MIGLLWGEDAFALATEVKKRSAELVDPEWRSVNLTVLDGPQTSVAEVTSASRTVSFFGNRLVVVRDCPWFTAATRKGVEETAEPQDTKAIVALLEAGMPDGCHLLLLVPKKIHNGMTTTKAAQASKAVELVEFPGADPYRPERTIAWVQARATEIGRAIEPSAADFLVRQLGQDKYLLDQEIAKLGAFAAGRAVTHADIVLLSPPGESGVFELMDAVAQHRLGDAIAHLHRILVHDHALKIIGTMGTTIRTWLQEKEMSNQKRRSDDIALDLKRNAIRVKKDLDMLRHWTSSDLIHALELVAEADFALKGSGLPDLLVMERLLAKLAV